MAWTNFTIDGVNSGSCLNTYYLEDTGRGYVGDSFPSGVTFALTWKGGDYSLTTAGQRAYIFGDSTLGIYFERDSIGFISLYTTIDEGAVSRSPLGIWTASDSKWYSQYYWYGLIFSINEETQHGSILCLRQPDPSVWLGHNQYVINDTCALNDSNDCYQFLKGTVPILYTWQSVPSISGKNGILSLPVLIDTDGNPVTNGSINDFSTFPAEAKVRTLADANI